MHGSLFVWVRLNRYNKVISLFVDREFWETVEMMCRSAMSCLLVLGSVCATVQAAEHRVEKLAEAPPKEALADPIAAQLASTGVRVIRGSSRSVCDIWLCKQWAVKVPAKGDDVIYPFTPGQLIGVVRYARKGSDFRDQDISKGIYTLRYAQQPVNGDHVGTSPTRDFLLLVKASVDQSAAAFDYKKLVDASAEAVESTHPGLLSLQRLQGAGPIRNDEQHDWWIVRLQGKAKMGEVLKNQSLDVVIVGQAAE